MKFRGSESVNSMKLNSYHKYEHHIGGSHACTYFFLIHSLCKIQMKSFQDLITNEQVIMNYRAISI